MTLIIRDLAIMHTNDAKLYLRCEGLILIDTYNKTLRA